MRYNELSSTLHHHRSLMASQTCPGRDMLLASRNMLPTSQISTNEQVIHSLDPGGDHSLHAIICSPPQSSSSPHCVSVGVGVFEEDARDKRWYERCAYIPSAHPVTYMWCLCVVDQDSCDKKWNGRCAYIPSAHPVTHTHTHTHIYIYIYIYVCVFEEDPCRKRRCGRYAQNPSAHPATYVCMSGWRRFKRQEVIGRYSHNPPTHPLDICVCAFEEDSCDKRWYGRYVPNHRVSYLPPS